MMRLMLASEQGPNVRDKMKSRLEGSTSVFISSSIIITDYYILNRYLHLNIYIIFIGTEDFLIVEVWPVVGTLSLIMKIFHSNF